MNTEAKTNAALERKMLALEARLDQLAAEHRKSIKGTLACNELLRKLIKLSESHILDLFDRMKNVELALFPDLQADINQLRRVIGEGDKKAYNGADYRKLKK